MAVVALAPAPQPRKLRIGVYADHALQPRWVVEAFAAVARSECAEIVAMAVEDRAPPRMPWWLRADVFSSDYWELVDLPANVPHANPAQPNLDVAFALGAFDDTKLDGTARLGVWRFQLDGAGEVAAGEPLTGASLTARLAAGEPARVAYESWGRTDPLSVARNRDALAHKAAEFALRALREAQRSGRPWLEQRRRAPQSDGNPFPSLIALGGRILRRGFEKALALEQWSLAFRFGGNGFTGELEGFTRIVPPAGHDWLDPFALEKNGRYYVFFEDRLRASGKGRIAMLELERGGRWSAPVSVLEREYSISHPFLLEQDGNLYLVPESEQNRTVEVYRCVDFPQRWQLERTLLDGVRLVDATFYRGPDRWWMFANGAAGDSRVFDDELSLFHAPRFLGDWAPHRRNPVKSDARSSRPAGALYWRNGALYRPAQVCAPRHGAGLALNRVLRLTPEWYAERQVERLLPGSDSWLLGLHTVNRAGDLTVVGALTRRRRI